MSRPSAGFAGPASRRSRGGGAAPASVAGAGVDLATVLGPVRSQNTFEETVERLLAVIKLGVVGRGDRFPPERELAALLGVSRITLREAIGDLRNAGYVESRRGRFGGTFVTYTPPAPSRVELRRIAVEDADKINDALTFRMAVETGAAQILARRGERGRVPRRPPPGRRRPGQDRRPPPGPGTSSWPGKVGWYGAEIRFWVLTSDARYPSMV